MKTQPPLTPEQQAEQVRQFDSVFPGMGVKKLNLTFDAPTADERLLLNPNLQVAELLGAKGLDWNGTPLRVLTYQYRDGKIVFACRTEQPRSLQVQTFEADYINSGFSREEQFWTILLSFLKPLA